MKPEPLPHRYLLAVGLFALSLTMTPALYAQSNSNDLETYCLSNDDFLNTLTALAFEGAVPESDQINGEYATQLQAILDNNTSSDPDDIFAAGMTACKEGVLVPPPSTS